MDPQLIKRWIPKSYRRALTLIPYTIGKAKSSNASKIIKILLREEQKEKIFLKRVRKLQGTDEVEVLICKTEEENKEQVVKQLDPFIYDLKELMLPKDPPLTAEQFEQWSKMWPINFIRHQITRQIKHQEKEKEFIFSLFERKDQKQYYLFKDNKILGSQAGSCQEGTIDHPIMRMLQQWPKSIQFQANPQGWYYLTGIYLLAKKSKMCGMCAMALVHSRLSHIYLQNQPSQVMDSILGCPKLNHQIVILIIQ